MESNSLFLKPRAFSIPLFTDVRGVLVGLLRRPEKSAEAL